MTVLQAVTAEMDSASARIFDNLIAELLYFEEMKRLEANPGMGLGLLHHYACSFLTATEEKKLDVVPITGLIIGALTRMRVEIDTCLGKRL